MDNTQKDKLQRPRRDKEIGRLPLPSDILVASGFRRCMAFLIDMLIIGLLTVFIVLPVLAFLLIPAGTEPSTYILRTAIIIIAAFWALYTVLLTISPLKGTIGQAIMRIYIVSYFGKRLTISMAFWRFLIFTAPVLLFCLAFPTELALQLPFDAWKPQTVATTELFYPFLMATVFCQFILAWPILTGNVMRVWWDEIVRCCVLQRDIRENVA